MTTTTILPPRRRPWRTLLLALLVFVCGVAVGAGATVVVITRRAQQVAQHPEVLPDRIADRLRHRLNLTADQHDRVRAILQRRQVALSRIRADVQPRVMRELAGVRDEVGDVLDTTQRRRWDALYDDLADRWVPKLERPTTRAAVPDPS